MTLFAAETDALSHAPGQEIGPYVLIRLLGEGGMGAVWLASQRRPVRRDVALKVLKRGLDASCVTRFDAERQMLAMLSNAHIAKIFDAGFTDDGRPFFAMEHVTGEPITTYADRAHASIDQRLELFLDVCDAVQHAHQRGVIHRDLKPANILVGDFDGRPSVKVIDFGIAKAVSATAGNEAPLTEFGAFVGTPEYMSPEQAGASDAVVDTRADIYSLGIVLYELLVGTVPFDAEHLGRRDRLEMLRVIREDDPPRLSARISALGAEVRDVAERRHTEARALARRLRGDLDCIVARSLEKDPGRRYPTVSELAADLRRHMRSEPIAARPPELRYRIEKFVRRHRVGVVAATAVLVAIVTAAIVSITSWLDAESARRETRANLTEFHVATGLRLADDGDDLRALPWLVRALELEEGGATAEEAHRIRIGHLLGSVPLPVRTWVHAGLTGAVISPDRRRLMTWDREGLAQVWDTQTGRAIGAPLRHPAAVVDARLSNDSVVTGDANGVVRMWNARGEAPGAELLHGPGLTLVRVTPDGSRALSADKAGGVKLWRPGSETAVSLRPHDNEVQFAEFLGAGDSIATSASDDRLVLTSTAFPFAMRSLAHRTRVVALAEIGPDTLISTDASGVTYEWNRRTGTLAAPNSLDVPNGVRTSATRASDGLTVLCGLDGAAMVRRDGRQSVAARLDGGRTCYDVDLAPHETLTVTGHADGSVRVWSPGGQAFSPRLPLTAGIALVRFLHDARYVLAVDTNGLIRVWDLAQSARAPRVGMAYTWTSAFSPDGERLALASGTSSHTPGGSGIIVDAETMTPLTPPLRHAINVRGIAFSPDGTLVATVSEDGAARLWASHTGEPVSNPIPHEGGGYLVSFAADAQLLLVESYFDQGGGLTLRRVPTGEFVARVPASGPGLMPDMSPDGRHIVITEPPNRVRVWRTDGTAVGAADWTGYESARFLTPTTIIAVGDLGIARLGLDGRIIESQRALGAEASRLFLSADRSRVAWLTENGRVELWATVPSLARVTGTQLSGYGLSGALSGDGRRVLAASAARVARVWTFAGDALTPERRVPQTPLSATFSPDGRRVQISGIDAEIWSLEPDARPVEQLRDLALRISGHQVDGTTLVPLATETLAAEADDPGVPPQAERRWDHYAAVEALRSQRWSHAAEAFTRLLARPNASWNAWAGLGTALAEQARWKEAEKAFARALALRPDSTELLFFLALAQYAGGKSDALVVNCRQGLDRHIASRNQDRAYWLARLCRHQRMTSSSEISRVEERAQQIQVSDWAVATGQTYVPWFVQLEARLRTARAPL
jgi:eukaryotic-like serine/threonine-protein kinase